MSDTNSRRDRSHHTHDIQTYGTDLTIHTVSGDLTRRLQEAHGRDVCITTRRVNDIILIHITFVPDNRTTERRFTLFDFSSLGETVPGLSVILPAALELHYSGRAAMPVDDTAVPGQRLGQPLGLALDAHLHGRRVRGLVRIVAVAGDGTTIDHLGRYNVDDGIVDFGHGVGGTVFLHTV